MTDIENMQAEYIEKLKVTLNDALEWLEDVRWDEDYISEDWYHEGRKLIPLQKEKE